MSDKINKATLALLDYQAFKEQGIPMPTGTIEWIRKHGIPDEAKILASQQSKIIVDKEHHMMLVTKEKRRVQAAMDKWGVHSIGAYKAYEHAYYAEVSLTALCKWTHISSKIMMYIVVHDKGYWRYRKLIQSGIGRYDDAMIEFYKDQLAHHGKSYRDLSAWTNISEETLKEILTGKQVVQVTYCVPVPQTADKDKTEAMLNGEIKPEIAADRSAINKRVQNFMNEAHMKMPYKLTIDSKFGQNFGIEIKLVRNK